MPSRHDPHEAHTATFHSRALSVANPHRFNPASPSPSTASPAPSQPTPDLELGSHTHSQSEDHSSHSPILSTHHIHPSSNGNGHGSGRPRAVSSSSTLADDRLNWGSGGGAGGGTGDEPGVDVRSKRDEEAYGGLKGRTEITIVDYSSDPAAKNTRIEFPGERLQEWLASDGAQRERDENGKAKGVRWIHVQGLNWEVVKALTLTYGLHPLAVEDALRAHNSPRSKLDFYRSHLYLQILVHHMHPADELRMSAAAEAMSHGPISRAMTAAQGHLRHQPGQAGGGASERLEALRERWEGGGRMRLPEGVEGVFEPSGVGGMKRGGTAWPYQKEAHRMTVDELSAKYMVPIRRGIFSVFMTRDGTLITLTRRTIREVVKPIYARLEDEQSLLRRSGDVSMLAQAILDVSVDLAIEISQTFEAEILNLEATVLVDPQMETVRHLHVLSSQLIRLRRSLTPLLHVCYIIRDQDAQRSEAALAMQPTHSAHHSGIATPRPQAQAGPPRENDKQHLQRESSWLAPPAPGQNGKDPDSMSMKSFTGNDFGTGREGKGFFSAMTKVYIGDVLDHLEIIVGSLDQFVATCDHLTDYVFNVLSFQTNESMERLSIVTVVFLPLTFIASYFGMNFTGFPEIEGSVSYFWKVAGPSTVAFFIIFSFGYLRAGAQKLFRRLMRWRRERMLMKGKRHKMAGKRH